MIGKVVVLVVSVLMPTDASDHIHVDRMSNLGKCWIASKLFSNQLESRQVVMVVPPVEIEHIAHLCGGNCEIADSNGKKYRFKNYRCYLIVK
jgi:hypothetical protein